MICRRTWIEWERGGRGLFTVSKSSTNITPKHSRLVHAWTDPPHSRFSTAQFLLVGHFQKGPNIHTHAISLEFIKNWESSYIVILFPWSIEVVVDLLSGSSSRYPVGVSGGSRVWGTGGGGAHPSKQCWIKLVRGKKSTSKKKKGLQQKKRNPLAKA